MIQAIQVLRFHLLELEKVGHVQLVKEINKTYQVDLISSDLFMSFQTTYVDKVQGNVF